MLAYQGMEADPNDPPLDDTPPTLELPPDLSVIQLYNFAAIHLSVAEDAIRRATGSPAPPKECWGCTDTKFHAQRFHLFRECPNRSDPDVRQNFSKRLGLFRQSRSDNTYYNNNNTYTNPDTNSNNTASSHTILT